MIPTPSFGDEVESLVNATSIVNTTPVVADLDVALYQGDALDVVRSLGDASVAGVVTSPPYLDARPEYASSTSVSWTLLFDELARVSRGGIALNVGRLWRQGVESLWWLELLERARSAGWELYDTLVWIKPNANPIQGRVLANSHEYVLLLGRDGVEFHPEELRTEYAPGSVERLRRRWISSVSVKDDTSARNGPRRDGKRGERRVPNEDGARARSFLVGYVGREKGNPHPAPMPLDVAGPLVCLVALPDELVLDPFAGSGTTLVAARLHGRDALGVELDPDFCAIAAERLAQQGIRI
jgi:DNA modification methylase